MAWKQIFLADLDGINNRNRHLEQQETEKIEFEVRDVDRIRITKCTNAAQGGLLGGHKSTQVKHKQILSPQPAAPHL